MRRGSFVVAGVALLMACRAFVDLDGLGGGGVPPEDAGIDVTTVADSSDVVDTGSGDAGVDAPVEVDAGTDVDAGPPCPSTGGPSPVRIPLPDGGSFCIDSTEVTNAQYEGFLNAGVSTANQGAFCNWNATYQPSQGWPYAAADAQKPVVWVDWCDAKAFCAWSGKRLCRAIGGQPLTPAGAANALVSEQAFACSKGGERVYPYGSVYDANKCNGAEANVGGLENVKSRATCEGGFAGVFDLTGNVHEWQDSCVVGADPATDDCFSAQSSYTHPAAHMPCTAVEGWKRADPLFEYGIRCCSD